MKYVMSVVCAFFCATSALANESEYCPDVTQITLRGGVYTAPANKQGSEWIAVASALSASPLKTFEGGVFYPENNQAGVMGHIGYCEYKANDRSRVNVHYRQGSSSSGAMQLENIEQWALVTSGLGVVLYECNASNARQCAFSVP
ncbi:DUF3757 domain-containing protein [Pseudomonas sp.]|uniref:DUF3757 domain-containing protein n=1 Tax=Pseudomonas sp. TaxID=306 RepID=UPI00262C0818|nr:DUF3757 domain-containing protein [Pseudomonas sp.]